jgi:cytochrome P450
MLDIRDAASRADDPFETFNRAQGQGSVRDPYPGFAALRAVGPVHLFNLREILGEEALMKLPGVAPEVYTVVSYDGVAEVLRDADRFSSGRYAESMGVVMGHTILEMDGAEHTRHRGLINKAFTRRALERWERELVRPVVNAYIDRFATRGRADLVRELTFPFPVRVIAGMMGLPEADHPRFHRWAVELISVAIDWDVGLRASRALGDFFRPIVAARRAAPGDDLIGVLCRVEVEGTRLRDDQIFAFLRLLAPAGAETTYRSSSNLLYGLLSNPDQLEAIRRDRSLIGPATEEGLRWECPLLTIMRTATRDTEIQGVPIPEGAAVSVNLGAANRDPKYWDEPDRFDLFREPHPHLAFAFGSHLCLGMHLARMETRVLLEALLDRLPELRLDPEAEDVHVTGLIFRSPLALPVRFEPRPGAAS